MRIEVMKALFMCVICVVSGMLGCVEDFSKPNRELATSDGSMPADTDGKMQDDAAADAADAESDGTDSGHMPPVIGSHADAATLTMQDAAAPDAAAVPSTMPPDAAAAPSTTPPDAATPPMPEVCGNNPVFEPDCTHRGFTKLVIVPHASNIVPCGVDRCLRATTAAGQISLTLHGVCEQFDAAGWIRFDGNCYLEWNDPAIPPLFAGDWSVEAAFQPGAGNAFPDFVYWVNDELPALRAGQQNIDTLTWAFIYNAVAIGQDLPPGRDVVTTLSYIGGTLTAAGQSIAVPNPPPSGRILRVGGDGRLDREFFGLIYWVVVR